MYYLIYKLCYNDEDRGYWKMRYYYHYRYYIIICTRGGMTLRGLLPIIIEYYYANALWAR